MSQVYYKYPKVRAFTAEETKTQDLEDTLHSTNIYKDPTMGILLTLTLGLQTNSILAYTVRWHTSDATPSDCCIQSKCPLPNPSYCLLVICGQAFPETRQRPERAVSCSLSKHMMDSHVYRWSC